MLGVVIQIFNWKVTLLFWRAWILRENFQFTIFLFELIAYCASYLIGFLSEPTAAPPLEYPLLLLL